MSQGPLTPQPLGLQSLSVELQELICFALCQQNHDGTTNPDSQKALVHLSGTSKNFQAIAQPLAYRSFPYDVINLGALVRTLHQRPDLAACVREFHQPLSTNCRYEKEQVELLIRLTEELQLCQGDAASFRRWENQAVILDDVCAEMIILLSPNLEKLRLYSTEDKKQRRNQYPLLYKRFLKFKDNTRERDRLLNLTHLEFARKKTSMPFVQPCLDLVQMLSGMPNLRYLKFQAISSLNDSNHGQEIFGRLAVTLKHLKTLEMRDCSLETRDWGEMFLGQLIAMAPCLESFRYATEYFPHPEPIAKHLSVPHILRALYGQHGRISCELKHLDIHLGAFARCKWPNRGNLVRFDELNTFGSLETLKLDENSICRCYETPLHVDTSISEAACLTETLPYHLKTLEFRVFKGSESHLWKDLVELGIKVDRYPKLESVVVQVKSRTGGSAYQAGLEEEVRTKSKPCQEVFKGGRVQFNVEFS